MDTSTIEKPRNGRAKRTYRCKHCSRVFKRSEHCARHERVHTQERPFPCNFCDRRYARKDLVKRHERSLHAEAYQATHPEEFRKDSYQLNEKSCPGGRTISTHDIADTTETSSTSWNRSPPTPPTDAAVGVITPHANDCSTESYFNIDQAFAFGLQSPLDQFSPSSSHEQSRGALILEALVDPSYISNGLPMGTRCSMPLWNKSAPSPSFMDLVNGSHIKQRRIEIDPLLLFDQENQVNRVEASSHEIFAPYPPNNPHSIEHDNCPFTISSDTLNTGISSLPFYDQHSGNLALHGFGENLLAEDTQTALQQHPRAEKEGLPELPVFKFNEETRQKICQDARARLPPGDLVESLFPNVDELNEFMSSYMQCFHRNFPVLHLASLDVKETPSPLIFAICSIGAQYCLARQKAKNLFALAGTMSSYALRAGLPINMGTPQPGPLWVMQTRVLLSLCGMFSGKTNVVMRTVENLGLFAIEYRLRISSLNSKNNERLEWEDWISRESSKRLLCGMFIVSNLISTAFGISPGFNHIQDLDFEVLDEERLWNARSAPEWMELRNIQVPPSTVRDTMAQIISDDSTDRSVTTHRLSSFTLLLIMHAVNIHIRNLLQCSSTTSKLQNVVLESASSILARCEDTIANAQGKVDHEAAWIATERPHLLNCQGLLQIAYIRLFSCIDAFDRLTLLTDNSQDVVNAVKAYVEAPQQCNRNSVKSVTKAFEMLLASVKVGYPSLRKTAALSWSIEHVIAVWETALFLTKWVHVIEMEGLLIPLNSEESHILEELKRLLAEVGNNHSESGSVAAHLALFSSKILNDCWIWGVAPRMGNVLQQLSFACEEEHRNLACIQN